ncbi:hypothetical protein JCGZ_02911 [Jatropha curcas]|uniref:glutathione transferase n=2 Tax=Jatropha curcas TaxID=180498 RepID=A0A067L146_JATCU|nr:glutathione S-transferase U7 isoform X1 [Jatropha curcas]KDP42181.1 hypothetical protein JCGZ_02911 [Jatropha curcas]
MGEGEVKLLGTWASPFSHRIKLALKLKGIQYEYIEQDLTNKSTLLLKSNPVHKKIPVLLHNGKPIAESLVILEYVDEKWQNNPFLPEDPYNKAMARFWATFVDQKILQVTLKASAATGEEKEQILEEVDQYLKLLENELNEKDLFGGENIGYLDIVAFSILYFFQIRKEIMRIELISEEKFPVLNRWIGKICEVDEVNQSLPPKDRHLVYVVAKTEAAKSVNNT